MEKRTMFVLTRSVSFHGRVFPEGCSCRKIPEVDHVIAHFNYMEKEPEKTSARTRRKVTYLIL